MMPSSANTMRVLKSPVFIVRLPVQGIRLSFFRQKHRNDDGSVFCCI